MRVFLLILSVAAILCSCTSGTRSVKEAGGMSAEDLARQETFDPATLPDKFVVPPPEFDTGRNVKAAEITPFITGNLSDTASVDSTLTTPGYRIQIFSTTSYLRANEAYLNSLATILDEPVYLTYDAPYYKIRAGNFIYREDAENFLVEKLKRTFPDAWVVRTFVSPFQKSPFIFMTDSILFADTVGMEIDTVGGFNNY